MEVAALIIAILALLLATVTFFIAIGLLGMLTRPTTPATSQQILYGSSLEQEDPR
jgi:hypothetical protein